MHLHLPLELDHLESGQLAALAFVLQPILCPQLAILEMLGLVLAGVLLIHLLDWWPEHLRLVAQLPFPLALVAPGQYSTRPLALAPQLVIIPLELLIATLQGLSPSLALDGSPQQVDPLRHQQLVIQVEPPHSQGPLAPLATLLI